MHALLNLVVAIREQALDFGLQAHDEKRRAAHEDKTRNAENHIARSPTRRRDDVGNNRTHNGIDERANAPCHADGKARFFRKPILKHDCNADRRIESHAKSDNRARDIPHIQIAVQRHRHRRDSLNRADDGHVHRNVHLRYKTPCNREANSLPNAYKRHVKAKVRFCESQVFADRNIEIAGNDS